MNAATLPVSYVLPIRWSLECDRQELTLYLKGLAEICEEIIVVDGSDTHDFRSNREAWAAFVHHIAPDDDLDFAMGKVNGVTTGLRHASHESVVIADDDVRYDLLALSRVVELLGTYDLVRPQNYFPSPMPWHAKWDTARTLLNRATGADFPGTLAVRRSTFLRVAGYDGDLIFENLELIRTIEAGGGQVHSAPDLFVPRLPSTTGRFFSQRVRQAYDDLALPPRMLIWSSILPLSILALRKDRPGLVAAGALTSCVVAEAGRRKQGGSSIFPGTASLFAPLWLLERAVCSWLALMRWATGGVRYGDRKIKRAATPVAELRRRQSRGGPS